MALMKEKVEKLHGVIRDEKKALQMEVEKQVEVQKILAAEVADKWDQVEKIRVKMVEEREGMQQELKNNQEVLDVMRKEKEAVEKEFRKTVTEKKAIEEEMLEQNELLGQNKSRLKTVDATLKALLKQTSS